MVERREPSFSIPLGDCNTEMKGGIPIVDLADLGIE